MQRPGMIVGGPLVGMKKDKDGKVKEPQGLYDAWVRLEVVPLSSERRSLGDVTPAANIYWIVDASRTQLYQLDANSVYVPFHVLQADLQMGPRDVTETQADGTEKAVRIPARASEIQIKLRPGANREQVIKAIEPVVAAVQREHEPMSFNPVRVETWEKQQEIFLGAVENEKSLVTFLFGLISLVAVFLIFCILYMIVIEKTRDIGIIKSVGATSQGVAAIFLGYGLAIGIVGATLGFALAWLIVRYINEIHTWLGKSMGLVIWKPEVYAFDKIPSTMDTTTIVVVMAVAVLSSVVGAVVPAVRAASLNPVEALRFE
jgi:lipoprotein-releasing system permease protein